MGFRDLIRSPPLATVSTVYRLGVPVPSYLQTPTGSNKGGELRAAVISQLAQLEIVLSSDRDDDGEGDKLVDQYEHAIDVLLKRIRAYNTPTIPEYLLEHGIEKMFPLVASFYDIEEQVEPPASSVPSLEEYLRRVTHLNQVIRCCKQLRADVQFLDNHKYIAHQVAVLYQSLNKVLAKSSTLPIKAKIESEFGNLKAATEKSESPVLPESLRQWVVSVTTELLRDITVGHPEYGLDLQVPIRIMKTF